MGPKPYPVIYAVANPARGLLERKLSEDYLQSSNESKILKKNKTTMPKRKERRTKEQSQKMMGRKRDA